MSASEILDEAIGQSNTYRSYDELRPARTRRLEVVEILAQVELGHAGWHFHVASDGSWFQIVFDAEDSRKPGQLFRSECREWRIAPWMGRNEIVKTALAAYLAAVQHEALEGFKYRGRQIFHPHHDVDTLYVTAGLEWA